MSTSISVQPTKSILPARAQEQHFHKAAPQEKALIVEPLHVTPDEQIMDQLV